MSRILLIEDEPGIAESLLYALQAEGFTADWFNLGLPALGQFGLLQPELVLLDVGLPDINGFELFRQLRRSSSVPVIFLTARADEIDRVVGLELGADDYVVKPFSPRELIARIRAVLRRVALPTSAKTGGFELDSLKAQIRYQTQVLPLTLSEYELLAKLLSQPERVFSREHLLDVLGNNVSGDRCIDTHIKSLRAKLRLCAPELDPIKTHRGLGYSLVLPR